MAGSPMQGNKTDVPRTEFFPKPMNAAMGKYGMFNMCRWTSITMGNHFYTCVFIRWRVKITDGYVTVLFDHIWCLSNCLKSRSGSVSPLVTSSWHQILVKLCSHVPLFESDTTSIFPMHGQALKTDSETAQLPPCCLGQPLTITSHLVASYTNTAQTESTHAEQINTFRGPLNKPHSKEAQGYKPFSFIFSVLTRA